LCVGEFFAAGSVLLDPYQTQELSEKMWKKHCQKHVVFDSYDGQLSVSFTTLKALDPALVSQLKDSLADPLFDKLNGSLSIDQERLKFAEYKIRVLEERLG
jgi:hypothetical protein